MRFHYPDPEKLWIGETDHSETPWIVYSTDPEWVKLSIRHTGVVARFTTRLEAVAWKAEQLRLLPVLRERSCGSCKACCTPLGIPALDKAPGIPCKHLCAEGCSIYAERPQDCREYFCGWRLGVGGETARPDQVGLLLTPHQNLPGIIPELQEISFVAHEVWPNARKEAAAQELLSDIGARGFLVLVMHGDAQCQVIGPADAIRAAVLWCQSNKRVVPFGILVGYEP